jgi:hypothetical protein
VGAIALDSKLGTPENPLTSTHFRTLDSCPYAFYLSSILDADESKFPIRGQAAKKVFIKNQIRRLFRDDHTLRFRSPESFASASSGWWKKQYTGPDANIDGKKISWAYDSERWVFAKDIKTICGNYYLLLVQDGYIQRMQAKGESPIVFQDHNGQSGYKNPDFVFEFEGRFYFAGFDEIWEGMAIKANGIWKAEAKQEALANSLSHTINALGFSALARDSLSFRVMCEVDDDVARAVDNAHPLIGGLRIIHNDLIGGKTIEVTRAQGSAARLREKTSLLEQAVDAGGYLPNFSSCGNCHFNIQLEAGKIYCGKLEERQRHIA